MNAPSIKTTNVSLTDEVREYVEKKCLAACDAFMLDSPTAIVAAELEYAMVRDGDKYRAEFTLQANGDLYRAEAWQETLHGAVDVAAEKLEKELRNRKGKKERTARKVLRQMKDYLRGV